MSRNRKFCLRSRHGIALCVASLLVGFTGCSSNLHGPWQTAFSRFWGFDRASATLKSAPYAMAESFESMVDSINGDPNAMDCSQDPFLDMQLTPSTHANPTESSTVSAVSDASQEPVVQTLFQEPPVESRPSTDSSAVQLAQHQQNVGEISSTENKLPLITPGQPNSSKTPTSGQESSLAELKNALQEDAKTRTIEKPPATDPALIRKRIDKMMQIANHESTRGEYAIALRMAMAAQQLVDTSGVFFGPEEQKPADLVANLRDRIKRRQQVGQAKPIITQANPSDLVPTPTELEPGTDNEWKPVDDVASTTETPAPADASPFPQEIAEPMLEVVETEPGSEDPFLAPPTDPQIASRELTPGLLKDVPVTQRVQANQGSIIELETANTPDSEICEAPPFPSQLPLEGSPKTPSVFDQASEFAAVEKPTIDFVPLTPSAPEPPLPSESIDSPRDLLIDPSARQLIGQEPSRNVDWRDDENSATIKPSQAGNPWVFPAGILGTAIVVASVVFMRSRQPRR